MNLQQINEIQVCYVAGHRDLRHQHDLLSPESIFKSWIGLWYQIRAGLIRVRSGDRRINQRVWIGIGWWQFGFWILHNDCCWQQLDLEHAPI